MNSLNGKRALVTGGSRGIGAAIARRFAQEGADVVLTYQHSREKASAIVAELQATGRRAAAIQADNADPVAIRQAVDQSIEFLGKLDVLVNNAGIFRGGPIENLQLEDIDATLAVNVRAVLVASQAAAAHMREGGRIISIGSNLAERVLQPGVGLYSASKAALIGWTKGLARELGPRGITVNVVQPGHTDTDMNPAGGPFAEERRAQIPIGRYGAPEEVAALVALLAGPEGGAISGASITIDGGLNV